MPTQSDIEALRSANAELMRLVDAELADFFAELVDASPEVARDALLDFIPSMVAEYGDVAAAVSAEWYEQVYGTSARLASPISIGDAEKGVRYAAGHLWTPTPQMMGGLLSTQLDKWVRQAGRDSITQSAERDGLRWARVPQGGKTCAFCLLLASRDAVYLSERSASRRADGQDYHGKCRCEPIPMESMDDYPKGYEPDKLYDIYMRARDTNGDDWSDTKGILKNIRRQYPELVTDGVHEH